MDFSASIAAQLSGQAVRCGQLVRFDFASGPIRLWNGAGPLVTSDGHRWEGLFGFGAIGQIKQSTNGAAPEIRFSLSGVDETFAVKAKGEASEYFGRLAFVFLQFFDEAWKPLDNPVAVNWGRMYTLTASLDASDDGFQRTVSISAESPFSGRRRPRYGYMTDRDQQQRFPGDRGCERVAGIQQKLITFPDY